MKFPLQFIYPSAGINCIKNSFYNCMFLKPLGLSLALYLYSKRMESDCCGIIGIVSSEPDVSRKLYEGIQLMQNRGYDSAGICTITKARELSISKYASDHVGKVDCFKKVAEELLVHAQGVIGLGHTRWATCGSKTDQNAHPHYDQARRVALVHNGTLENYVELKQALLDEGVQFSSETDTEVIAQMVGKFLKDGAQFLGAVQETLKHLHGQWGLAIIDRENPEEMIVCRNGSPILVGYNQNSIYVASEKIAFEKYTQNYIQLQDGETMLLSLKNKTQIFTQHRLVMDDAPREEVILKPKEPFHSFFEMEIFEQPASSLRCLGNGARLAGASDCSKLGGFELMENELIQVRHLLLLACGSSYNAVLTVLPILKAFRMFDSIQAIEASEFRMHDLPTGPVGAIFISQSGETKDLVTVLNLIKSYGVIKIGVVNVVGSLIASQMDCGVYINCGREVGVAASKSFTSQVIALILIGLWFSKHRELRSENSSYQIVRENYVNQLRSIPMVIGQTLEECKSQIPVVADELKNCQHLIIIGKWSSYAIAREGALKIKEITYIHAEAFCAGELKHGPLALVNPDPSKLTPVILIILDDDTLNDMKLALSEVHSRNAKTIVISDSRQSVKNVMNKIDHLIIIPKFGLSWLLAVIPFQLLALQICQRLGVDPDKPRNLAKTVTVG